MDYIILPPKGKQYNPNMPEVAKSVSFHAVTVQSSAYLFYLKNRIRPSNTL